MQIGVASSSSVGVPVLRALLESHHKVDFVITNPQKQSGRGKLVTSNDFHNFAKDQNIKVLTPSNSSELLSLLRQQRVDVIVTIAYGQLIKPESLVIPKYGWLNIHFSQLPRWRGASPVQSAILAGDVETGISIFLLDEGMDTGPIWTQIEYQIPYATTSPQLFKALSEIGVTAVSNAIDLIAKGSTPTAQSGEVSIAAKVKKEECRINWSSTSEEILRKIRAFAFNPGVFTFIRGEQIKISEAHLADGKLAPGEISATGLVGTADGAIQLLNLTPAGKKAMAARDWLNGFKPQPGERFE